MKLGAIDVGTNSLHLAIVEIDTQSGDFETLEVLRAGVRLGSGDALRAIPPAAFRDGVAAMVRFARVCQNRGCQTTAAVATEALRAADNSKTFCEAVERESGIRIRVLTGPEEARMSWLGASRRLDFRGADGALGAALLIDLGGGSTELILGDSSRALLANSARIGHVRSASLLASGGEAALRARVRGLVEPARSALAAHPRWGAGVPAAATGGTAFSLGRMAAMARGEPSPEGRHGLWCGRGELPPLLDALGRGETPPGMDLRRRDTLRGGGIALHELLIALERPGFTTCEAGIREGAVAAWVRRNLPSDLPGDRSLG